MTAEVHVGTSSWADPGFIEEWYPPGLPAQDRLPWYAEHFDAVEVNSTFYAVPGAGTVARWAAVTPDAFTFDVKLHRLLSRHAAGLDSLPKALREGAETTGRGRVRLDRRLEDALLDAVLEAVDPLVQAGKLSSFLLQLTPGFNPKANRLEELRPLVERLAPHPVAIELRHRGWAEPFRVEDTLAWYEDAGAVWVAVDAPPGEQLTIMPPLDAVTRPGLAYLRAHGRNTEGYTTKKTVAERFAWRYADEELEDIKARVLNMAEQAGSIRVQFNNNARDDAPVAALRFKELLSGAVEPSRH